MNIIEYAETQMNFFETNEWSSVDSLILSQFAYLFFDDIVPGLLDETDPIPISGLLKAENFGKMLHNVRDPKNNRRLLLALGMSPRFRDIRMCFYVNSFDAVEQKQFAAVTFLLDNERAYIAYRGTDNTFIGWKEDFNMAFISPVPAQQESVGYLNAAASRIPHKLIVGGHSKGGNLAIYSAMECNPSVQDRIVRIYSHDGPGFRDEILTSEKYQKIKTRIHKTLPQAALVGMLLQHQENYFIVESKHFWVMQHDPFSWIIEHNDFRYAKNITVGAEHINTAIKQWLAELDDEKRELFVTTLYSVIEAAGVVNFNDLSEDWQKKASAALDAARGLDSDSRGFILGTIKSLAALSVRNLRFSQKKNKNKHLRGGNI